LASLHVTVEERGHAFEALRIDPVDLGIDTDD
jgi:hypothetical protein